MMNQIFVCVWRYSIEACKDMFPLRREFIEAGSWCCIQRRPAGGTRGGHSCASACPKPPSKTFPSHSAIKSETPVRRTSSVFFCCNPEYYQNGERCQLKLSTFPMKSVSAPITRWYTGPILPEHYYLKNPFFWHYQLKLANYTTTFCFESHLRLKLPIILKRIL